MRVHASYGARRAIDINNGLRIEIKIRRAINKVDRLDKFRGERANRVSLVVLGRADILARPFQNEGAFCSALARSPRR